MQMLQKISQSKTELSLLEDEVTIQFTSIHMPSGGAKPTKADFDRYFAFHKRPTGILVEPSMREGDCLCALKAITIGLEWVRYEEGRISLKQWNDFRHNIVNQRQPAPGRKSRLLQRALRLLGDAEIGVDGEPWSLDELRQFEKEKLLPDYCLKIISSDHDDAVIYDGLKERGDFEDLVEVAYSDDRQTRQQQMIQTDLYTPRRSERQTVRPQRYMESDEEEEERTASPNPAAGLPTIIHLLQKDQHFTFMKAPGPWFGKSTFCQRCNIAFAKNTDHKCSRPCHGCGADFPCRLMGGDPLRPFLHCVQCDRYFSNQSCFDRHNRKQLFFNEQQLSVCETIKYCSTCEIYYPGYESGRKVAHKCDENIWCGTCKEYYNKNNNDEHYCFVTNVPAKTLSMRLGTKLRKKTTIV